MSSCVALSLTISLFSIISNADTQTISYDSTQNNSAKSNVTVDVDCEIAEIYEVVLPKQVTLDGSVESPTYEYTVNVKGEIGNGHYVRVIPLNGAKLSDGYVTLDLSVTQGKRRWNSTEISADTVLNPTTGTMSAGELTPGVWSGKVNFLVTLDDGGTWIKSTCTTPAYCLGYDTNDNCVVDTSKNIDVVNLNFGSSVNAVVYNNCLQGTTAECQSQAAIDILNTDNTEIWVRDLEGLNNGYPLIR